MRNIYEWIKKTEIDFIGSDIIMFGLLLLIMFLVGIQGEYRMYSMKKRIRKLEMEVSRLSGIIEGDRRYREQESQE